MTYQIKALLQSESPIDDIDVKGWVRTKRDSKGFSFIEINDGSCLANIQAIADEILDNYEDIKKLTTGSSVMISGDLLESPGKGQKWEIKAKEIRPIGYAPDDFPLQKKRHSDEYLRTMAHLRPRTNKFSAIFRIRSRLSQAIHDFFKERGFHWIHTPIITGSDCEGAGNMFRVTTLGHTSSYAYETSIHENDFFGKEAKLTVSGQLPLEMLALSLGKVYSFGPTFRAENSNTSRHIAEFWMVEPEMAFSDLEDNMDLAEQMIKNLIQFVIEECSEDLELFARFVDKDLMHTLANIADKPFLRITYTEAMDILHQANEPFEYKPEWGNDLQSEHERFLTEKHFKQPVIVYNYPRDIKAFYMRQNDDGKTVASMDVLVPKIGEIIGGSQREERLDRLLERIKELGLNAQDYWWYLDTRRYGTVEHSGFGLGFERLLMLLTGITNIRDVIPFPRTPNNLDF